MSDKWLRQQATANETLVSVNRSGDTWRDHLAMAGLMTFLIGAGLVASNISQPNEAAAERTLCATLDQRFVSSHYYFDEALGYAGLSRGG